MQLVELTYLQFDEFALNHPLSNFYQTSKYALFMSSQGFEYDYMGFQDDSGKLVAASLILKKKITGNSFYGYAPRGFLIDYYNLSLLTSFIDTIKKYYKKKNFIFVKFDPEIIIGETDKQRKFSISFNGNVRLIDDMKNMKIKKRKELQEFDFVLPKFNAYVNLKQYDANRLCRQFRKKIRKDIKYGMKLTVGGPKDVEKLYALMKDTAIQPINYYRDFYNTYSRDNSVDLVFVEIDMQDYLTFCKNQYEQEFQKNDKWNELISREPTRSNLNHKMNSDKKLAAFKDKVINATNMLRKTKQVTLAGAIIVKHLNRISILVSGINKEFTKLNPNHFLYYAILERYKNYFSYCDLGGVTGTFDNTSQYFGLNDFKKNWNSTIYEFIGEFDIVCHEYTFKRLIKTSFIEKEFNKHPIESYESVKTFKKETDKDIDADEESPNYE